MKTIFVKDFSTTPGPGFICNGPFSGEKYLNDILLPAFDEVLKKNEKLIVNLDGCLGFAYGFSKQSFGELSRIFGSKVVLDHLEIICTDEPSLIREITSIIRGTL